MATKNQIKASVKYNKTRDSITIRPDKATGEKIRSAAKEKNISITELILTALKEYINK